MKDLADKQLFPKRKQCFGFLKKHMCGIWGGGSQRSKVLLYVGTILRKPNCTGKQAYLEPISVILSKELRKNKENKRG